MSDVLEAIYRVIQGGDQDEVARLTEKALAGGIPALEILGKGMIPGVEAMGEKFRSGEFFLPEVLISARVMNRGVEVLTPSLSQGRCSQARHGDHWYHRRGHARHR